MNKLLRWGTLAIITIIVIVGLVSLGSIYEDNGAGEILVVQAPFSGELSVYTDPGRKWQGWGTVTHYRRSNQFEFLRDQKGDGNSIKIRFNDGGHAQMSGSGRYDLPLDVPHVLDIHQTYGSPEALHTALIKTVMEKSIYMTGPLVSSKESYSEKRSDLINLIEDQAISGVYSTVPANKEVEDYTGAKKWVTTVDLRRDAAGNVIRQEKSPLVRFGIKLYNVAINDIGYEKIVEDQITSQQKATMDIQIAIASSKRADQDILTAKKEGEAATVKAKWLQEVEKATVVTKAEQEKLVAETQAQKDLAVATFARQSAEQIKQREILLGEGEAKRKQLNMAADGALTVKTQALIAINEKWANAIAAYKGDLVPRMVMGAGAGNQNNSVVDFIELMKAKAARDLALDMSLPAKQP